MENQMNKNIQNYYKLLKENNEDTFIKVILLKKDNSISKVYKYDHLEHDGMSALEETIIKETGKKHTFNTKLPGKNILIRIVLYSIGIVLFPFLKKLKKYSWKMIKGTDESLTICSTLSEEETAMIKEYCKKNRISKYVYFLKQTNNYFKKKFLEKDENTEWLLPVIYEKPSNFKFMSVNIKKEDTYNNIFQKLKYTFIFELFSIVDIELFLLSLPISMKIKKKILNQEESRFASFSYFGEDNYPMDIICGITPATNLCKITSCSGIFQDRYSYGINIHKSVYNNLDKEEFVKEFREELLKPIKNIS